MFAKMFVTRTAIHIANYAIRVRVRNNECIRNAGIPGNDNDLQQMREPAR